MINIMIFLVARCVINCACVCVVETGALKKLGTCTDVCVYVCDIVYSYELICVCVRIAPPALTSHVRHQLERCSLGPR